MKQRLKLAGSVGIVVLLIWGVGAVLDRQPPASVAEAATSRSRFRARGSNPGTITWQPSLASALTLAKRTGRPIMADFFATWCGPCRMLDESYGQPDLKRALKNWITVKVDVDKHPADAQTYGASSLPTLVFLNADGQEAGRMVGFAMGQMHTKQEVMHSIAGQVIQSINDYGPRAGARAR